MFTHVGRKEMMFVLLLYEKVRTDKSELLFHPPNNELLLLPIYKTLERRNEMFYLTMHSTHFIYSYVVSNIW